MNMRQSITYVPNKDLVGAFLNKALTPVYNLKVKSRDIDSFIDLMKFNNSSLEMICEATPALLIRLFFTGVQIPAPMIEFLHQCVFVIRSQTGLYDYDEPDLLTGKKIRHEVRMGFLELFVQINYGLNLRVSSGENENTIGVWQANLNQILEGNSSENDNYNIEILPPKNDDLSSILEFLAVLETFQHKFTLPIIEPSTLGLIKSEKLKQALKSAFKDLLVNVKMVVDNALSLLPQPLGDDKNEVAKAGITISSLNTSLQNMFLIDGQTIHISAFPDDIFNFIVLQYLMILGKNQLEHVAILARDEMYRGESTILPRKSLEAWLYQILSTICHQEIDEVFSLGLKHFIQVLTGNNSSDIEVTTATKIGIPVGLFNHIFTPKNIQLLNSFDVIKINENVANEVVTATNLDSATILRKLVNPSEPSAEATFYIRKIRPRDSKNLSVDCLDYEFESRKNVADNIRVRPATFMVPGIPIKTYGYDWKNYSGVVIITPPDEAVPMVGYKRPAYSHKLIGKRMMGYGFPAAGQQLMQSQGGKPLYTTREFYVRMQTIILRTHNKLDDMPRKEVLRNYFRSKQNDIDINNFLNSTINFSTEEWQSTDLYKTLNENSSNDYKVYIRLHEELRLKFLSYSIDVQHYYLDALRNLVHQAHNQNTSLLEVLSQRELKSYNQRFLKLKHNKYLPTVGSLDDSILQQFSGQSKRYVRHHSQEKSLPSNEALLQGLLINDKSQDYKFPLLKTAFDETRSIKKILLNRHGNYAAIYANTNSLADAFLIHHYLKHYYQQSLSFITYDECEFKFTVFSEQEFAAKYKAEYGTSLKYFHEYLSDEDDQHDSTLPASSNSSSTPIVVRHQHIPIMRPTTHSTMSTFPLSRIQVTQPLPQTHTITTTVPHIKTTQPSSQTVTPTSKPKKIANKSSFKYSPVWRLNKANMLREIQNNHDIIKKVYEKIGVSALITENQDFTCNYDLQITLRHVGMKGVTLTKTQQFKNINGIFAFEANGINSPEYMFKQLTYKLNPNDYNLASQPLTFCSFEIETIVKKPIITCRDKTENLFFSFSTTNYLLYSLKPITPAIKLAEVSSYLHTVNASGMNNFLKRCFELSACTTSSSSTCNTNSSSSSSNSHHVPLVPQLQQPLSLVTSSLSFFAPTTPANHSSASNAINPPPLKKQKRR